MSSRRSRLPIGQLLGRMLRLFRAELYRRGEEAGYTGIREAHLHVFGNISWKGSRLTDLAASAGMTRPSMSELVDELETAGYLTRLPDPTDGRAKLIVLTRPGRRLIVQALRWVRDIEGSWAEAVGPERYETAAKTLQALVDEYSGAAERPDSPPPVSSSTRRSH